MLNRDDTPVVQIGFRWNPNTFRGFIVAMTVMTLSIIVSMCTKYEKPAPYQLPDTKGIEVLIFGYGDGTGAAKGNLQKEGKKQKGQQIADPLEDATRAAASKVTRTADDPTQAGTHIPVKDLGQAGANRADGSATDVTRGAQDGDEDGTGRGWAGTGTGKGMGFGDIDWGGGGNRIVLNKVKPQFPPGTLDTKVQLRFRVRPDGTVSIVTPMRKGGNPAADQAAIKAMYQWRFNPLSTDKDMEGTITFVFKSS